MERREGPFSLGAGNAPLQWIAGQSDAPRFEETLHGAYLSGGL